MCLIQFFFKCHLCSKQALQNGSSESCESASTSSIGSNNSHNNTSKAPGAQLQHKNSSLYQNSLSNGGKATSIVSNSTIPSFPDFTPDLRKQVCNISFNLLSIQLHWFT